jgi:hypothetical protein
MPAKRWSTPTVEHLATQQVFDLLEIGAGLAALPVVGAKLAHRCGRGGGQCVELHLGQHPIAVVHLGVPGELFAFSQDRLLEEFLHLLQRAVEVVLAGEVSSALGDPAGEVVQTGPVGSAPAQKLPHRPLGR